MILNQQFLHFKLVRSDENETNSWGSEIKPRELFRSKVSCLELNMILIIMSSLGGIFWILQISHFYRFICLAVTLTRPLSGEVRKKLKCLSSEICQMGQYIKEIVLKISWRFEWVFRAIQPSFLYIVSFYMLHTDKNENIQWKRK